MRPAVPSVVVVLALTLLAGCGGGGGGGGKPQQKEAAEQRERAPQPRQEQHTVVPTVETTPVSHSGDAADDAAIWVNPSDPARSTIIGTDKLGGIAVYDRAGTQLQYRDENATYNNVDLRTDFPLGDQRVALVAASDRTQYHRRIVLYSVDPGTGTLTDPVGTIRADYEPYGLCMYRSQESGRFYVFVTGRNLVGETDRRGEGPQLRRRLAERGLRCR